MTAIDLPGLRGPFVADTKPISTQVWAAEKPQGSLGYFLQFYSKVFYYIGSVKAVMRGAEQKAKQGREKQQ